MRALSADLKGARGAEHRLAGAVDRELGAWRPFDAIILAVEHDPIVELGEAGMKALLAPGDLIYDLKEGVPPSASDDGFRCSAKQPHAK